MGSNPVPLICFCIQWQHENKALFETNTNSKPDNLSHLSERSYCTSCVLFGLFDLLHNATRSTRVSWTATEASTSSFGILAAQRCEGLFPFNEIFTEYHLNESKCDSVWMPCNETWQRDIKGSKCVFLYLRASSTCMMFRMTSAVYFHVCTWWTFLLSTCPVCLGDCSTLLQCRKLKICTSITQHQMTKQWHWLKVVQTNKTHCSASLNTCSAFWGTCYWRQNTSAEAA